MSTRLKKGFTLIELMVVIVIIGILAAIAIPKLFGMTAKAKAQEVGPAAGTWVKLHQAYYMEKGVNGKFEDISYIPPGQTTGKEASSSVYFSYKSGKTGSEAGKWHGVNDQGALGNGCELSDWEAELSFDSVDEGDMPTLTEDKYKAKCEELTKNFEKLASS